MSPAPEDANLTRKPLSEVVLLGIDTETTGPDATKHAVVEVGWALTHTGASVLADSVLVNPGQPITSGAKAIHHIVEEDVAEAPSLMDALKTTMVPQVKNYPIDGYFAHNAKFDKAMMPMLNKKPWLCTYRLARKLYPLLEHHTNQFLRYELALDVQEAKGLPAHRALADIVVTAALVRHLIKKAAAEKCITTFEDLCAFTDEPFLIEVCPFQKHKDQPWKDVVKSDPDYCQWILGPTFKNLDEDTRYTIEHWKAKEHPQGWPAKKEWRR